MPECVRVVFMLPQLDLSCLRRFGVVLRVHTHLHTNRIALASDRTISFLCASHFTHVHPHARFVTPFFADRRHHQRRQPSATREHNITTTTKTTTACHVACAPPETTPHPSGKPAPWTPKCMAKRWTRCACQQRRPTHRRSLSHSLSRRRRPQRRCQHRRRRLWHRGSRPANESRPVSASRTAASSAMPKRP